MKEKFFSYLNKALVSIKGLYHAHPKVTIAICILIFIFLAVSPSFFKKSERALPPEELFSVTYDEEDQGYVVRFKTTETPEVKEALNEWFRGHNVDLSKTKVRSLTLGDQTLQKKTIDLLPLEMPDFYIQYFDKTDVFLVQIKLTDKSFDAAQEEALTWFKSQGIIDFSKIKIRWLREGPGMSDEL